MDMPTTRYARTEFGDIAYQTLGDGPHDLLFVSPLSRCLDHMWDYPAAARTWHELAVGRRLIWFDRRGSGISDPLPADLPPSWEDWVDDIVAVLDAVGSRETAVFAERDSCAAAVMFASSHPERTSALILCNTSARFRTAPGYAYGESFARTEELCSLWETTWGTEAMVRATRPALVDDPEYVRWVTRMQRAAYSPRRAAAEFRYVVNFDVRSVLHAITVPTLILHRRELRIVPLVHGQYLADHIPHAKLEILPGADMNPLVPGDPEPVRAIDAFLASVRQTRGNARPVTTLLMAVMPETAQLTPELDREWRGRRDAMVAAALLEFQGRAEATNIAGAGLAASFDGPARGLRFADALRRALRAELHIEPRMGLHVGQCEREVGRLAGGAVAFCAEVMRAASAGEILVSPEACNLAQGSGIALRSAGRRTLGQDSPASEVYALDG